jgi:splicing factor 3A subunit 1
MLDPQWRDQRAKAESRYATTNLSTQDVANNLKRLASQRTDVFDQISGQPISEEEQARRKKAATAYDGNVDGEGSRARPPMGQPMNIQDQLKSIHQRFGQ